MAWTAPRTWVAGETVTAAIMNTHVRDNLKAIGDAWTAYTPTWTSTGTAPAIGNGTLAGRYMTAGKLVLFRMKLLAGSTTTFGTGLWSFALPVSGETSLGTDATVINGMTYAVDTGVKTYGAGSLLMNAATTFQPYIDNMAGVISPPSNTFPFTWGNTDIFAGAGVYEAA